MFLYTVFAAAASVAGGLFLALRSKKAGGVSYGVLDRVGRITNILLLALYTAALPFTMFLGMISAPACEGLLGVLGWAVSVLIASASLFCGLGLGFAVALRKKGRSRASFAVQFAGVLGIGLSFGLYAALAGSLLQTLN